MSQSVDDTGYHVVLSFCFSRGVVALSYPSFPLGGELECHKFYRVSGGAVPRHKIIQDLRVVIVLNEGYHKFCVSGTGCHIVSIAQDATIYVLVTLRGRDRVVSRVVQVTIGGVVPSRAT